MQDVKASIVLPLYNQSDQIKPLIDSYRDALSQLFPAGDYEIILVTNACRDDSPRICSELASKVPQVRAIDTKSGGWGRAVKLGLAEAKGELLCFTNSARTSAQTLVDAIELGRNNPGFVVKANRKIRESLRRRLGSLIYNLECRAFFDLPIWDVNGTPKVFPRSCKRLLSLTRNDDLIDCEFNAICKAAGYQILEMPVLQTKRYSGKSTTNYKSAFRMYWGAFDLWRSMRQRTSL